MRKWAFKIWAELILKNEKAPNDQILLGGPYATNAVPEKNEKALLVAKEKFNYCLDF